MLEVNLTGSFLCSKLMAPGMVSQGWGRIVNIASLAGKDGTPAMSAYSASKAGVIALTKAPVSIFPAAARSINFGLPIS